MNDQTEPAEENEPEPDLSLPEKLLDLKAITPDERTGLLTDLIKTAAGRSGGALQAAVDEFLVGKGELLDAARSSLTRGKTAAKNEIAIFLSEKFNLSPQVAKVIASLLIKMVPVLGKVGGTEQAAESKPRKKKKAAAKTAKKTVSKSGKKPVKKKTAAAKKVKAKKPVRKKAAAKKSTASTSKSARKSK